MLRQDTFAIKRFSFCDRIIELRYLRAISACVYIYSFILPTVTQLEGEDPIILDHYVGFSQFTGHF